MNFMGNGKFKWNLRDNRLLPPFFLSIVIIEAVILIPSYHNYERDLLLRLEQVGRASIVSAFLAHKTPNDRKMSALERAIVRDREVAGGRLYHPNGSIIGNWQCASQTKKSTLSQRLPSIACSNPLI